MLHKYLEITIRSKVILSLLAKYTPKMTILLVNRFYPPWGHLKSCHPNYCFSTQRGMLSNEKINKKSNLGLQLCLISQTSWLARNELTDDL